MSRFVDDAPFHPPAPKGAPPTAGLLLGRLHVTFAPFEVQRATVAEWLKSNIPEPRVERELRERNLMPGQTSAAESSAGPRSF